MATIPMNAVLFDLDGVLVRSGEAVERSWTGWARRHGLAEERVLATCHGRPSEETIGLLAPHLDAAAEARLLEAEQAGDVADVQAVKGASELVGALDAVPVPWAVVTSGTWTVATARLAAAGLRVPDVFITADAVTRGKPDPEGYARAARLLGVPAGTCVVLEDSEPGARAGRAAGAAAVIGVAGGTLAAAEPMLAAYVDTLAELSVAAGTGGHAAELVVGEGR